MTTCGYSATWTGVNLCIMCKCFDSADPGLIKVLKVHYVALWKTFQSEEKDPHWLMCLRLNKLNKQALFVFMTD